MTLKIENTEPAKNTKNTERQNQISKRIGRKHRLM